MDVQFVVSGRPHASRVLKTGVLGRIVARVLNECGAVGQPPEAWELRDYEGRLFDHFDTVGEAGISDGQTLFLNPRAGVGGNA